MTLLTVKSIMLKWLLNRKDEWASTGLLPLKSHKIGIVRFAKLLLLVLTFGVSIEFAVYVLLVVFRVLPNGHRFFELHPPKEALWPSIIGFLWDNGRWYVQFFLWDSAMLLCSLTYLLTIFWNLWAENIVKSEPSFPSISEDDIWPPAPQ